MCKTPEFHYPLSQNHGGKSDRGPDHGNRRIVSLVTNRRVINVQHANWKDIVATPAFILTHFVANRLVRSTQILVSEVLRAFFSVTIYTGDRP
jgi:hypothetical protein